jgi:hypothetical protein
LTIIAAGLLLLGITPWPGFDVHHLLWERALERSTAWQLVYTVGGALLVATIALWHRYMALRRTARVPTGGLYAITPHPAHIFLGLAAFATALLLGRPSSFGGAVLLSLAFWARAMVENHRNQAQEPAARREPAFTVVQVEPKPVVWRDTPVSVEYDLAQSLRIAAVPLDSVRNENRPEQHRLAS